MSEQEKINREYAMIARDLKLARESFLLRIIRNKRQPISARYAAMILYSDWPLPEQSLDESILSEDIRLFLCDIDRKPL